jgi:RecA-family ATPase
MDKEKSTGKLSIAENNIAAKYLATMKKMLAKASDSLQVVDLATFLNYELPPRENLLTPWLTTQSLNMIYAARGVGKTFMALNIAYAVATGTSFLHWSAPKARGVLLIDGEMPAALLKERLQQIVQSQPQQSEPVPLYILTLDLQGNGIPDLATPHGQRELDKFITDAVDLIILDNLSSLMRSGRENEAESWLPLQTWAQQLRAQHKSVLFIHHAGRNGQARGTSRREDVLDTMISLKRPDDYSSEQGAAFVVEFMKARHLYGADVQPFIASLTTQEGNSQWQIEPHQGSTYEQVIFLAEQGHTQTEIAKQLQVNKSTVSRYCKQAIQDGRLTMPKQT